MEGALTMAVNFNELIIENVATARDFMGLIEEHWHRSGEWVQWAERLEARLPTITAVQNGEVYEYEVYIPPFHPSHFAGGVPSGDILGPFDVSIWGTLREAEAFLESTLSEIEAGKYSTWGWSE